MTIFTLIAEEAARFEAATGQQPTMVFLGAKQAAQIDAAVDDMKKLGLLTAAGPISRARIHGLAVFRVDAENHLSFGIEQPSACG